MSPFVEGLLIVIGTLITSLLTFVAMQMSGLRVDTKELITSQQDFNNRLIELETEHQVLWSERRERKIIQLDRASGEA